MSNEKLKIDGVISASQGEHEQKTEIPKEENNPGSFIDKSLKYLKEFEPSDKQGAFLKDVLQESLYDAAEILKEDSSDTLNLLIAYRGIEETWKNCPDLQKENFSIVVEMMNALKENIKTKEGFDIEEIKNLDEALKKEKQLITESFKQDPKKLSQEASLSYGESFKRYFALKSEIQQRQKEILGESKSFYGGLSKRIFTPLVECLSAAGEKIDQKLSAGNALLKYIGRFQPASKIARSVGIGLVTAGALAYIFKGDIGEAAESEIKTHSSLAELSEQDPEIFKVLQETGLVRTADLEAIKEEQGVSEKKEGVDIFNTALQNTQAKEFLSKEEYRQATTPKKLESLYNNFNEKDQDPSDDIATAIKYNDFLREHNKEKLIQEYGQEAVEKLYQQAGYTTFKSLEKYFNLDIRDGGIDSEDLKNYIENFRKASEFYKTSLNLSKELMKQGELHKAFNGIIEMNDVLSNISNTAIIFGEPEDKITAAQMRQLIYENIKEFKKIEQEVDVVHLGKGKFLFPDIDDMCKMLRNLVEYDVKDKIKAENILKSWETTDYGGVNEWPSIVEEYLNGKIQQGGLSQDDEKLANILTKSNALIKEKNKYKANPEMPTFLFTSINTYNHENQHHEFLRNDALIKHWIDEWNANPVEFREEFIKSFVYREISPEHFKILTKQNFSFEEIKNTAVALINGTNKDFLGARKYEFLQEFQAYSTDNSGTRFFNPKYEIK